MSTVPNRKGDVGTALACFMTAWTFPAVMYLALTRAPYSKPAPEGKR